MRRAIFIVIYFYLSYKDISNTGRRKSFEYSFLTSKPCSVIFFSVPMLIYYFARGGGYNNPVFVPDDQMADFLHAVGQQPDRVQYFTPEQVSPAVYGRSIRIIGGALDGYEGRLMSRRGSRKKQLIIELEGLLSAAIEVEPDYIQLL